MTIARCGVQRSPTVVVPDWGVWVCAMREKFDYDAHLPISRCKEERCASRTANKAHVRAVLGEHGRDGVVTVFDRNEEWRGGPVPQKLHKVHVRTSRQQRLHNTRVAFFCSDEQRTSGAIARRYVRISTSSSNVATTVLRPCVQAAIRGVLPSAPIAFSRFTTSSVVAPFGYCCTRNSARDCASSPSRHATSSDSSQECSSLVAELLGLQLVLVDVPLQTVAIPRILTLKAGVCGLGELGACERRGCGGLSTQVVGEV